MRAMQKNGISSFLTRCVRKNARKFSKCAESSETYSQFDQKVISSILRFWRAHTRTKKFAKIPKKFGNADHDLKFMCIEFCGFTMLGYEVIIDNGILQNGG